MLNKLRERASNNGKKGKHVGGMTEADFYGILADRFLLLFQTKIFISL
jgi:hypothetical protein